MTIRSRGSLLLVWAVLGAAPALADTFIYDKGDVKAFVGGFAELDAISDTTRSLPESIGSNPVDPKGTANGGLGRLQFSPRNSRFDFGMISERNGIKSKGYLEFDLLGYDPTYNAAAGNTTTPNTENSFYQSATMRVRHAYMSMEGDSWSFLAGQYWSLFGWQNDYVLSTVSVNPVTGVAYERIPQLTAKKNFGSVDNVFFEAALSLERPAQRDSATPNIDGGLRLKLGGRYAPYTAPTGTVKNDGASLGVSGTYRDLTHPEAGTFSAQTNKRVGAVAIDLMLPVIGGSKGEKIGNTLALAGEYTRGQGYGDEFPGWTGNIAAPNGGGGALGVTANKPVLDPGLAGYTATGDLTIIHLQTWNGSLQYHLPEGMDSWVTGGFGELSSDNVNTLVATTGKTAYNRSQVAFGNIVHDFTSEVRAGLEYDWVHTGYVNNTHAQDNRIQLSTWYRF